MRNLCIETSFAASGQDITIDGGNEQYDPLDPFDI